MWLNIINFWFFFEFLVLSLKNKSSKLLRKILIINLEDSNVDFVYNVQINLDTPKWGY